MNALFFGPKNGASVNSQGRETLDRLTLSQSPHGATVESRNGTTAPLGLYHNLKRSLTPLAIEGSPFGAIFRPVAAVLITLLFTLFTGAQPPVRTAEPQPVTLVMENQFDKKTDLEDYRGSVVILVYGDRKGTEACRKLGEHLHVAWHPDAAGQMPAKAQSAPVAALQGLQPGQVSPDVRVIPVACCGKVPGPIRGAIRSQIAKSSPDVPVWLDFTDAMKANFTLTAGEPNLVVFDASGRLRMKINGTPDAAALERLAKSVKGLRYDAVKVDEQPQPTNALTPFAGNEFELWNSSRIDVPLARKRVEVGPVQYQPGPRRIPIVTGMRRFAL